jgi:hypothetical protein
MMAVSCIGQIVKIPLLGLVLRWCLLLYEHMPKCSVKQDDLNGGLLRQLLWDS